DERGPEHLVPTDDLREGPPQRGDFERAAETDGRGEVVARVERVELVQEPQPLLPERQWGWPSGPTGDGPDGTDGKSPLLEEGVQQGASLRGDVNGAESHGVLPASMAATSSSESPASERTTSAIPSTSAPRAGSRRSASANPATVGLSKSARSGTSDCN